MRSIRVHYSNGDTVDTEINGTNSEIIAYYVNRRFNLGDGAGGDLMAIAVRVDFLDMQNHAERLMAIADEYDGQLTVDQLRHMASYGISLAKLILDK